MELLSNNRTKKGSKEMRLEIVKIIRIMAFHKPWFYLCLVSYVFTHILVWAGNPLLPFQFLASYGWAWHHIPEILSFLFLGMWFGSWGFLSSSEFNYFDLIPLTLLIVISVAQPPLYLEFFWLILIIVSIPSFVGYIVVRLNKIRGTLKEAYKLLGINDVM